MINGFFNKTETATSWPQCSTCNPILHDHVSQRLISSRGHTNYIFASVRGAFDVLHRDDAIVFFIPKYTDNGKIFHKQKGKCTTTT